MSPQGRALFLCSEMLREGAEGLQHMNLHRGLGGGRLADLVESRINYTAEIADLADYPRRAVAIKQDRAG